MVGREKRWRAPRRELTRERQLSPTPPTLRVAPRPATFGSDDAAWRRFAAEPFEMWALTSSLYRVEPSDGVHVTAKANRVYSHLLATHLLRTVLPQRAD